MSASHIILDCLPSLCQKLPDLVEVWRSYNKNNFARFFETLCICHISVISDYHCWDCDERILRPQNIVISKSKLESIALANKYFDWKFSRKYFG